jgi:Uma2 family endonuclease
MATAFMTYEDYVALPDDGERYEVIEGELCEVPVPDRQHQKVLFNLAFELRKFIHSRKLGNVYISPFDVVLSSTNIVQPDVLFVSNDRFTILTDAGATGAPDLAIEVSSASTLRRDEVIKLRLYESFGVDEYWIVDPFRESLRIHRRREGKLVLVSELSNEENARVTTPLLPRLAIPLAAIFED